MSIGEKIKSARKLSGLTQKELGEKLGVSGSMVGAWETGKRTPKYPTIKKIATALNTTPILLYYEGAENFYAYEKSDTHSLDYLFENLIEHNTDPLSPEIMKYYESLNSTGKAEATKRVEELTHIEKYTVKEPSK